VQGDNELRFNQATMQDVVEHYLNNVMFNKENQCSVSKVEETGTNYSKEFVVTFNKKPEVKVD